MWKCFFLFSEGHLLNETCGSPSQYPNAMPEHIHGRTKFETIIQKSHMWGFKSVENLSSFQKPHQLYFWTSLNCNVSVKSCSLYSQMMVSMQDWIQGFLVLMIFFYLLSIFFYLLKYFCHINGFQTNKKPHIHSQSRLFSILTMYRTLKKGKGGGKRIIKPQSIKQSRYTPTKLTFLLEWRANIYRLCK